MIATLIVVEEGTSNDVNVVRERDDNDFDNSGRRVSAGHIGCYF